MFKSQGQTTLLSPVCCPLYIYWSLAFLLLTGFASSEKINLNFAPWRAYMFLKHFLGFFFRHYVMSLLEFFSRSTACEGKDCVQAVLKYMCIHILIISQITAFTAEITFYQKEKSKSKCTIKYCRYSFYPSCRGFGNGNDIVEYIIFL